MFPPTHNLDIDARAISGITGSISIACWVIVFSPQIIVNFRRGSADGLSLAFLAVWLLGDVFNVLGAVLQGVLPTMVILAIYYTFADIVLLGQCLYYRFKTQKQQHKQQHQLPGNGSDTPTNAIIIAHNPSHSDQYHDQHIIPDEAVHLSPATPLLLSLDRPKHRNRDPEGFISPSSSTTSSSTSSTATITSSTWRLWSTILLNTTAIIMVCLAGIVGWLLTPSQPPDNDNDNTNPTPITFDTLGQIFGYLCAILYLASRVPQIYLNYTRKTVEGLSLLFFLFACLGNLTYVISIMAYVPRGAGADGRRGSWTPEMKKEYWTYIAVNASWLLGSVGTLFLDLVIFMQFFWYRDAEVEYDYDYEYERISDEEDEAA